MTTEAMPTVRQQFIDDYMVVVENNSRQWDYLTERAQALEVSELAQELESDFEEYVCEITKDLEHGGNLLIRQMLLNQGLDTYYHLARAIMNRVQEIVA